MDGVRQRQRGWSSLTEPGLGAAGSAGRPPRSPGTSRVTVCTAGRAGPPAPPVIYDPLPLPGGSSGPAAEGPEQGDREQRQPGQARRGGASAGERKDCGGRPHLLSLGWG